MFIYAHMTGDEMDKINLSEKQIRDLCLKYAMKLKDGRMLSHWYSFKENEITGVGKFTAQELRDDIDMCRKYQAQLITILGYRKKHAFDFEKEWLTYKMREYNCNLMCLKIEY